MAFGRSLSFQQLVHPKNILFYLYSCKGSIVVILSNFKVKLFFFRLFYYRRYYCENENLVFPSNIYAASSNKFSTETLHLEVRLYKRYFFSKDRTNRHLLLLLFFNLRRFNIWGHSCPELLVYLRTVSCMRLLEKANLRAYLVLNPLCLGAQCYNHWVNLLPTIYYLFAPQQLGYKAEPI